jgi:hypothetical protein
MTKEQINIAIAEHLGVSVHPIDKARGEDSKAPLHGIADYYNDLNAMRHAEMSVVYIPKYWENLIDVVLGFEYIDFDPTNEYSCLEVATASSRQRAEAFLKTIGKWEGE